MPKIFREYIYQRFVEDIIIYSYGPLLVVLLIATRLPLNIELLLAITVNYVMYIFSFMYNDVEDRVEDANSPSKRFKNPFGYKVWSIETGFALLTVMAIFSIVVSWYIGGLVVTLIAISNLLMGLFYSMKRLRLKNYVVIDLISHSYLLAAVQALYFLAMPNAVNDPFSIAIAVGVTLFSVGGDLENEYRDFEDDQKAGLKNSAHYLGKENTHRLSRLLWLLGIATALFGIAGVILNLGAY